MADKIEKIKTLQVNDERLRNISQEYTKTTVMRLIERRRPTWWPDEIEEYWRNSIVLSGSVAEGMFCARMFKSPDRIFNKPPSMEVEMDFLFNFASFRGKGGEQDRYLEPTTTPGFYLVRKYPESATLEEESFGKKFGNSLDFTMPWLFVNDATNLNEEKYLPGNLIKKVAEAYNELRNFDVHSLYFERFIASLFEEHNDLVSMGLNMANMLIGGLTGKISIDRELEINGPSAEIRLLFKDGGNTVIDYSLDTVLAIRLDHWPDVKAKEDWLHRERQGWPPEDLVKAIAEEGGNIVSKKSPSEQPDSKSDLEWRLSFSRAEEMLAMARTDGQKLTYYVFKSVYYSIVKNIPIIEEENEKTLPSYFAKTIMFWESENRPTDHWSEERVVQNVKDLMLELSSAIKNKKLQHYFLPEINLLAPVPEQLLTTVAEKIPEIVEDPLQHIPVELITRLDILVGMLSSTLEMDLFRKQFLDFFSRTNIPRCPTLTPFNSM